MSHDTREAAYRYSTIDYTHPDPRLRSRRAVAVNFYDGYGVQRCAGVDIEVGR